MHLVLVHHFSTSPFPQKCLRDRFKFFDQFALEELKFFFYIESVSTSIFLQYGETYPTRNMVRNCKVLSRLSREMFSLRESWTNLKTSSISYFIFCRFIVSMDAIKRVSNSFTTHVHYTTGFFCYFFCIDVGCIFHIIVIR